MGVWEFEGTHTTTWLLLCVQGSLSSELRTELRGAKGAASMQEEPQATFDGAGAAAYTDVPLWLGPDSLDALEDLELAWPAMFDGVRTAMSRDFGAWKGCITGLAPPSGPGATTDVSLASVVKSGVPDGWRVDRPPSWHNATPSEASRRSARAGVSAPGYWSRRLSPVALLVLRKLASPASFAWALDAFLAVQAAAWSSTAYDLLRDAGPTPTVGSLAADTTMPLRLLFNGCCADGLDAEVSCAEIYKGV